MNKILTRISLLCCLFLFIEGKVNAQAATDIFISEYVEGSSNNKALEFFNGTSSPIDLTASNYVVQMYFNGSLTASTTINLTGTIAPNGVFVLAQASASFAASGFVNQTSSASWYNGDDAIVLRKGGASGTIVDVIGQVGFDPGTEWGTGIISTADNTLRRKTGSCSGDINNSDVFDPAIQFDGFATDDFTGLGAHSSTCVVAGNTISITPGSLNFSTTAGVISAEQSYTVSGNSIVEDITVTIPALSNFGLSLTPGGPYTSSLLISAAAANAAPVPVYIIFNPIVAGTQTGNVSHTTSTTSSNLAVVGSATTAGGITPIYSIQGTDSLSTLLGNIVTTEGIVTADFQGASQMGGFFIQDTTGDGNALSSDGIFVFNSSFPVNVGDYVRLTGTVDEFFSKTEIKTLTALTILSTSNTLPVPISITLPAPTLTSLEAYEGMLVSFPQTLTVTETFTLGRFGELSLSVDGRVFNPTNFVDPNDNPATGTGSTGTSNIAAVLAQQNLNDRRRILLDDGSTIQNPPIVPYLNPADSTLRIGTTASNITGALDYDFGVYRLQPTQAPVFNYAARPQVPALGPVSTRIGSFNVLNYFNGNGSGGGFPTSRGANTLVEFNRQRAKIIAAIKSLNTDITGLIEIENDGDGSLSAIADLVNGLNAATSPGTYAYIPDATGVNGNMGTDEIKVALIYKPSKVTPVGPSRTDIDPVHNRPPLAQTFLDITTGEKFTVIVTHFKSKSCTSASGANADQGDGQGCYNANRKLQASALLNYITTLKTLSGDSDIVAIGDFNAYEQEDPIDMLLAGGLVNLLPNTYSYVFDGQSGSLDHGFASATMSSKIAGAAKWHINSDEPIVKDYNQEFNPAYVYSADAYRSSDHDPLLIGISQPNQHPIVAITSPANGAQFTTNSSITVTATASDSDGMIKRVEFFEGSGRLAIDSIAPYTVSGANVPAGIYRVTARAFDNSGDSTISDTVIITVSDCTGSGSISALGYTGIPGSQLINLASHPSYPSNPSVITTLPKFEYGPDLGDEYGAKLRGYICAPQTGNYIFYISSNDQSELWLSTDSDPANIRRIAFVSTQTNFRAWFTNANQRSIPIFLVKGARYYVETVHKEGTGSDHLSVSWLLPNGVLEGPINGNRLSPYISNGTNGFVVNNNRKTGSLEEALLAAGEWKLIVNQNPTKSSFQLQIISNSKEPVAITLVDVLGRIVEKKTGVFLNSKVTLGTTLTTGIYFAEIQQGAKRKKIKLIKE